MPAFIPSFFPKTPRLPSPSFTRAAVMSAIAPLQPNVTLYSVPVSNYSARVRYLIYRKKLSDAQVEVRPPKELGGLKTEEYLALNPLGKIPTVIIHTTNGQEKGSLYESSVICEYLAEVFEHVQPSFVPSTPEKRAAARLIANLLDIYIGPQHPYMYKKGFDDREEGAAKMKEGFDAIERAMDPDGPYAVGNELSLADCCLWGNWPFYEYMLPTFFGWTPADGRPKLAAWVQHMRNESDAARHVYVEVFKGLEAWWDKGRWENMSMKPLTPRPQVPF